MKLYPRDIVLASAGTTVCVAAGLGAAALAHRALVLPHGFQMFYLLGVFAIAFAAVTVALVRFLQRVWPMREGELVLSDNSPSAVWKLMGYLYIHCWPLMNASLVPINWRALAYRLLGARIGRHVMIGGKILDPSLVEIGDYSHMGEDCVLTAHSAEGPKVVLGRIAIGRNVTVGTKAVVLPYATIGDGAIVAAGAVVKKGAHILPGEIWGGVPARKIGERDFDSLRLGEELASAPVRHPPS